MAFDVVRGNITKLSQTKSLVEYLSRYFDDKNVNGTLYLGYPLTASSESKITVDALLLTESNGLLAFIFPENLNDAQSIMNEQDTLYYQLDYNFKKYDSLRLRRGLSFQPEVISIFPDNSIPTVESDYLVSDVKDIGTILSTIQNFNREVFPVLCEALQRVSNIKPRKKRENVKNDLSYGGIIKKIEKEIANLDQWQKKAALEIPEGPQRIRGLAGSGKTIVLALKAAYLHSQYPDWKIAVTFYTRALSQQYMDLIQQFAYEFSGDKPNWDKLHIVHSWGTNQEPGIYSIAAQSLGVTPYNFMTAKNRYGRVKAFEGICDELIGHFPKDYDAIYDAILIDEAQDMPSSFFKLVYEMVKKPKRITWAYDELQNLNETEMPSLEEMFGLDIDGNLKISLQPREDEAQQDIILPVCYRNPPWGLSLAHSLGFGIYRDKGKIQMFSDLKVWEDIGYKIDEGRLGYGNNVVLSRRKESTPKYFEELIRPEDSIYCNSFDTESKQYQWVAQQIKKNLEEDELDADDILVIFPDAYFSKREYTDFRKHLQQYDINSILAGVSTDRDTFRLPDHVSCSSIYRAKGNEAPMVYIVNTQYCSDGIELIKLRNILFTAITRSRGWIRICGIGEEMKNIEAEVNACVRNEYKLRFKLPTKEELDKMRRINRERTEEEVKKLNVAQSNLKKLINEIDMGELDPELIPELESLVKIIKDRKLNNSDED